jgi:hypothetical protein
MTETQTLLTLAPDWPEPPAQITEDDILDLLKKLEGFEHPGYPGLNPTQVQGIRAAVASCLMHGAAARMVAAEDGNGTNWRGWKGAVRWEPAVFVPAWLSAIFDRAKQAADRERLRAKG